MYRLHYSQMRIKELFEFYKPLGFTGDNDTVIENISTDSSKILSGGLFFAIKGGRYNGNDYISEAEKNGAVAVVTQEEIASNTIAVAKVGDVRLALSRWSAAFYGFPQKKMNITGITGTNGKTTIANLIYRMLLEDSPAGLIGTSGYDYGDIHGSFGLTTPFSNDLYKLFSNMLKAGIKDVVMEVSSHALELERVSDISFSSAVFSNLSQDHLDFHGNMDKYYEAKFKLFTMLKQHVKKSAIVNIDDEYGIKLAKNTGYGAVTFAIKNKADYTAEIKDISLKGSRFYLSAPNGRRELSVRLIGSFNIYNCLAAMAWAIEGGKDMETVCNVVSNFSPVAGRMEIVRKSHEDGKFVVIDYAHTPAALENVLITLRELTRQKLICVFGCGGDRDREKRPLMGRVAGIISDRVYITSDNPRTENPMNIVLDIELGLRNTATEYYIIPDRSEAISMAIKDSDPGDCILIAGKGDEDYQLVGDERMPFSDRLEAHKYL
ncbi:UDP-N-acetylmuramoyl-L-alanyl-D-glutamate--2,6-diaminopimelate ligase [Elusimicrobiota bacterium]